MKGDSRLAGARPALHDEDAPGVGPDDAILLSLDRGDDVRHPAGATRRESGHQRRLRRQCAAIGLGQLDQLVRIQHVVADPDDLPTAQLKMASPADPQRLRRCRPVEGLCCRRPPIDQQPLTIGRGQADPADVVALAVGEVQPAETQAVLHAAQLDETALVLGGEGIPF